MELLQATRTQSIFWNCCRFTINTKLFAIQKKFLRGINFVKITKNTFQATRLPEERMGVTEKIGGRNEFP